MLQPIFDDRPVFLIGGGVSLRDFDWSRLSRRWRADLDARIEQLQRLRDDLDGCIGCGCLSLNSCALYNADDAWAASGPGPRRLLAGTPEVRRPD